MSKQRITATVVNELVADETMFENEVRGFIVSRRGGVQHHGLKTRNRGRHVILNDRAAWQGRQSALTSTVPVDAAATCNFSS